MPITRSLALHQITAMEAGPIGLVSIAADTGCDGVCVFTHVPAAAAGFPLVTVDNKATMLRALSDARVTVTNVEFFPLSVEVGIESYREALALGAELGAVRAVTHIHDTDAGRAVDSLGRLADLAATYGLGLGLEFMGLTPGCLSIQRATWFVDQVARSNLGIAVDALHLVRTGGTPADVAALAPHYFAYAQICDGHGLELSTNYLPEALDREMPGDGDFPLRALIAALPRTTPLDVEVPSFRLARADVTAAEWAREAVQRSRLLIDQVTAGR